MSVLQGQGFLSALFTGICLVPGRVPDAEKKFSKFFWTDGWKGGEEENSSVPALRSVGCGVYNGRALPCRPCTWNTKTAQSCTGALSLSCRPSQGLLPACPTLWAEGPCTPLSARPQPPPYHVLKRELMRTYCVVQGTLLRALRWPTWEGNPKIKEYMYYAWLIHFAVHQKLTQHCKAT